MRRVAALLVLPALVAGCLGQADEAPAPAAPAAPTDAPTPEDACATRGILPETCEVFCTLNPETCGLPPPIPDPYPPVVTVPAATPSLPVPMGAVPTVGAPTGDLSSALAQQGG